MVLRGRTRPRRVDRHQQAELTSAGQLHRYSWEWEYLEDEHGFLTDHAIDPGEDLLETIPAEEFQRVWSR